MSDTSALDPSGDQRPRADEPVVRFPDHGADEDSVLDALEDRRRDLLDYSTSEALGLAGTSAVPVAVEALRRFAGMNANNVGWHEPGGAAGPWAVTRELEAETVTMVADLVGGQRPGVSGFLTGGGAESNLMALWMAREVLGGTRRKPMLVAAGRSVHGSIVKSCAVLGIDIGAWEPCARPRCRAAGTFPRGDPRRVEIVAHRHRPHRSGRGLHLVDLDADYRMDPGDLARQIEAAASRGVRRFAVVATIGTTTSGAVDSVADVGRVVAEARRAIPRARFYVHVDAAMGGMVVPFLPGDNARFGFDLDAPDGRPVIDSMSIDLHKAGLAPMAAGLFLGRAAHRGSVYVPRSYQPGRGEATLPGSRPGAAAAAAWAALKHVGRSGSGERDGYAGLARRSFGLARTTAARLTAMGAEVAGEPQSNIVSAVFPRRRFDVAAVRAIAARHAMFAMYLSRSDDDCPREAYRFCLMPHVREATLEAALAAFAGARRSASPRR